jgi:DNA-binding transcriptional MocR family regulator
MGPAVVGPELLPGARLNRSIRLAMAAFGDHATSYEEPSGNLRLRRQLARLAFRQGVHCQPDDVIVTNGVTEAMNLSLRAVARAGDVIAVESPGCYDILHVLETLEMRAVEVPHVVGRGISLEWLKATVERHQVKAVVLTATCHNPIGDRVSDDAKADLVGYAATAGLPLIEGDHFGELMFSGERPRTLKAFDTTGIVLSCGSLAHYVAPGLNVGWLLAGRWRDDVTRMRSAWMSGVAALPQLAMAEFLESGAFDRHVRSLRAILAETVERVRHEILRAFPAGTRVSKPEGGFVLWVQLPGRADGLELAARALEEGIQILPGCLFSASGQYRDCVRISCGRPYDVLRPGIHALARLAADAQPAVRQVQSAS